MTGYHTYQNCIEACLKCAAICNYRASSCTQEEDVKMMAKCIQLDMECAGICYAAAQIMSLAATNKKSFPASMPTSANNVGLNVASIKQNIVKSVQKHVANVPKNAVKWRRKSSVYAG